MNYNPMGMLNGFPENFFNPNFKNAVMQGYPFPYNVLNQPLFKEGVHYSNYSSSGLLPYDVYNKQPVEPTEEELEQEYKEIMGNKAQPKQSGKDEQEKKKSQSSKKEKQKKSKKSNAMISFDTLTAGSIQSSSGIFNGKNIQFGWSAHSKTNNGFGTVGGNNNTLRNNINVVFDNDQLDTPIDDRDIMWSPVPTP